MPTKLVEFHDEAGTEYDAAFDWYLERSPDAALAFDGEVARCQISHSRHGVGPQVPSPRADTCCGDSPTF